MSNTYTSFSLNLTLVPPSWAKFWSTHLSHGCNRKSLKFTFVLSQCLSNRKFQSPHLCQCPVTGISKSVFFPVTKGSRMTSLHMSQYFPVSQYFPEYYQHCLIRHLQISLWEVIRQLLSQCLFWERTHFPSISHYSQSILRILPSDLLGMFQMGSEPNCLLLTTKKTQELCPASFTHVGRSFIHCKYHHVWIIPSFRIWCLYAACCAHFMCHHELCPTPGGHPLSFLNSFLDLTGGEHY